jgi:ribokinase
MKRKIPAPPAVIVLGDITIDLLARIEGFAEPGADYVVPELEMHCGGVGANLALALRCWGVSVRLLGCVGRDWFGERALRTLRRGRVNVTLVQRAERSLTGLFFIAISPDGQRTMFGSRGANAAFRLSERSWAWFDEIQAVHLVGYSFLSRSAGEAATELLEKARQKGALVTFDPGLAPAQQIPETILKVARQVDILLVNSDEAAMLTGKQNAIEAARALEAQGIRQVVVKLGPEGCLLQEEAVWQEVPAFPVSAVDTTGAGDAFVAGFLRASLSGWSLAEAGTLANAAGAAAASVVGAGERMPGPRQILEVLEGSRLPHRWDSVRERVLKRLQQKGEEGRRS